MSFTSQRSRLFSPAAVAAVLLSAAVILAAGPAAADDPAPVWNPAEAKFDFTSPYWTGPLGSSRDDPNGQINVSGLGGDLNQDTRFDPSQGLGIMGRDDFQMSTGEEIVITAIPQGSAQGVSGVWLSSLFCGLDGGNVGVPCSLDGDLGEPGNNQLSGEVGSVEIDYLDPESGAMSCRSFLAVGTEDMRPYGQHRGQVFVDFGGVLQMVSARVFPKYQSDLGSACTGEYSIGALNNNFTVLGFVLEESIDTSTECEAGSDCTAVEIPGLTVTIENSPPGTFTVVDSQFVVDTRAHCQPDTPDISATETLEIDLDGDEIPELIVPANMCGIPRPDDGIPQIWIQDIDWELETPFFDQLVEIEAQNPENPDYFCAMDGVPNLPLLQPLQAWIPRDGGAEVPVLVDGERSKVVQDVTTQCGSYKGKSRALSYLVGNLRYVATDDLPDFVAVISAELDRLDQTILSADPCVSAQVIEALSFGAASVRMTFDLEMYDLSVAFLEALSFRIDTGAMRAPLLSCQFDLDSDQVVPGSEVNGDLVPALLFGYLQAQIDHLIFQIENKMQ